MSQEAGAADDSAIRPFTIDTPEEQLADLRSRIKATRWPDRETDASQGVRLETIQALADYWASDYDWRKFENRLAARMAVTQRPATQEALTEPSGEHPLWKQVPSWFLIGEKDRNIPAALHRFMAERAGARRTVEIPGASHAISVSQPEATAELILDAAGQPAGA
jgi:pimeloyl-ACP methyl ester carboxylesterase